MDLYTLAVYAHIVAGTVALGSFWTAGLLRKGQDAHRRAGKLFLVAMLAVIASGFVLVRLLIDRGQPVSALFLGYLLILVGNGCWGSWRAIRDRRNRAAYFGPIYWILAASTAVSGLGIVLLGVRLGAPLFMVFGGVGVLAGIGAMNSWRRAPSDPTWWLREHYGNMIGNGVAIHIAFLGVGLRNALPWLDPVLQQNLAWLAPLLGAAVAGIWLNRKYGRPASVRTPVPSRRLGGSPG